MEWSCTQMCGVQHKTAQVSSTSLGSRSKSYELQQAKAYQMCFALENLGAVD